MLFGAVTWPKPSLLDLLPFGCCHLRPAKLLPLGASVEGRARLRGLGGLQASTCPARQPGRKDTGFLVLGLHSWEARLWGPPQQSAPGMEASCLLVSLFTRWPQPGLGAPWLRSLAILKQQVF